MKKSTPEVIQDEVSQRRVNQSFSVRQFFLFGLAVTAALFVWWGYSKNLELEAAEQARYDQAVSQAMNAVPAAFANWRFTSNDSGVMLNWSGSTSKILYVDAVPSLVSRGGFTSAPHWTVYAATPGGRYFSVGGYLDKDLNLKISSEAPPRQMSQDGLVNTMVQFGRTDVLRQFGLPEKSA